VVHHLVQRLEVLGFRRLLLLLGLERPQELEHLLELGHRLVRDGRLVGVKEPGRLAVALGLGAHLRVWVGLEGMGLGLGSGHLAVGLGALVAPGVVVPVFDRLAVGLGPGVVGPVSDRLAVGPEVAVGLGLAVDLDLAVDLGLAAGLDLAAGRWPFEQ